MREMGIWTCITGYRQRLLAILDQNKATATELPLDQDVIEYTIDSPVDLTDQLTPLQYLALEVAVPVPPLVDLTTASRIDHAKEFLTVLISRILGANVTVHHYLLGNLLVLSPRVNGRFLVYRMRQVITNFKAQIDPNLLLHYRVIDPHPLSMLPLSEPNHLNIRYLEDIPLTSHDQLPNEADLQLLTIANQTRGLLEQGWRVVESLSDTDRKVQLLQLLGPVKTLVRGDHTTIFYRPDEHLLISSDWVLQPKTLTLVGDWMYPNISDTIVEGGGLPPVNPVGTVSGVQQRRRKATDGPLAELSQWTRYRAKLYWNIIDLLPDKGWIGPTLSLTIETTDKWREALAAISRPIDRVVVTPIAEWEQGEYAKSHLEARGIRSLLIPANFDFLQPEGWFLLTDQQVEIPHG